MTEFSMHDVSKMPTEDEVLEAVRRFWVWMETSESKTAKKTPWPTEDPKLRDRFTELQIDKKMHEMSERGILDYGCSVRGAWVVEDELQKMEKERNG